MLLGQLAEHDHRLVHQLGVGREGDVLRLHRGVDADPGEVPGLQRAGLVRHPQALLKQDLEFVADALAPMAQPRALVREAVLKEGLAGEVLEIRIGAYAQRLSD